MIKVDGSFEHFSSNSSTLTIQLFHVLIDTAIHHKKNLLNHVSRKKKQLFLKGKFLRTHSMGPLYLTINYFLEFFLPTNHWKP